MSKQHKPGKYIPPHLRRANENKECNRKREQQSDQPREQQLEEEHEENIQTTVKTERKEHTQELVLQKEETSLAELVSPLTSQGIPEDTVRRLVAHFTARNVSVTQMRRFTATQWIKHLPNQALRDKVRACFGLKPYKYTAAQKQEMIKCTDWLREQGMPAMKVRNLCIYFQNHELPADAVRELSPGDWCHHFRDPQLRLIIQACFIPALRRMIPEGSGASFASSTPSKAKPAKQVPRQQNSKAKERELSSSSSPSSLPREIHPNNTRSSHGNRKWNRTRNGSVQSNRNKQRQTPVEFDFKNEDDFPALGS